METLYVYKIQINKKNANAIAIVISQFFPCSIIENVLTENLSWKVSVNLFNVVQTIEESLLKLQQKGDLKNALRIVEQFLGHAENDFRSDPQYSNFRDLMVRYLNASQLQPVLTSQYPRTYQIRFFTPYEQKEQSRKKSQKRRLAKERLEKETGIVKTIIAKKVPTRNESVPTVKKNSQENIKPELEVDGLVAFDDGTIRYKGNIVKMRSQIKDLCRLFMRKPKRLVTHEDIRLELIDADKRSSTPYDTIAKYVSELRNSLKAQFGKNVIINQSKDGWVFDTRKM